MTRKLSYSSFFSAWCTDLKNVTFEKIHWSHSEVIEVKCSFSRSLRPNLGFHLVFTSFFLEFLSFLVWRSFNIGNLSDLRRGSGNFSQKLPFWNQCIPKKEMRHVSAFSSKFSLKPYLSGQWSIVRNFVRGFVCISFVWLTSLWELIQTKLMQMKPRTKLVRCSTAPTRKIGL